jgi:hypothetical protein
MSRQKDTADLERQRRMRIGNARSVCRNADWDIRAARLEMGDVAFIPRREPYQHWTEASHAKIVYVSSGKEGAGQRLIAGGKAELSHVSK